MGTPIVKVLIAIKGSEDAGYYQRVAALLPSGEIEVLLAHVIDTGPRQDLEAGRERYLGRRPLTPERSTQLTQAEDDRARAVLQHARGVLESASIAGRGIREVTLRGKPKEELRALAEAEDVDLIVVGGHQGKPGPHSLGKTARFMADHTRRAALLVR